MKLAIMQPYFFPYIGYWQLIHAVDCFVLFDDAQYMRHGWINRNRILKPSGGWQYILVPLKKHSQVESIKNVLANPDIDWKKRILGQLAHYKKKARYFNETNDAVKEIFSEVNVQSIAGINSAIIYKMCTYLDIKKELVVSSEKNFDYENVGDSGEWALRIAEQMGADEYINPVSGAELFSQEKFASSNIALSFLKTKEITYSQQGVFEPLLSIIDVMMFNGINGTKELLVNYSIELSDQ
jgi:hypothetical protein